MYSITSNHKKYYAVFVAAALILACVLPVYAAFTPMQEKALANPEAYNMVPVYQWHRVTKQSDLPKEGFKVPVMILWQTDNNIYYGNGTGTGKYYNTDYTDAYTKKWDGITGSLYSKDRRFYPDPFSDSSDSDSFYSLERLTDWTMAMSGKKDSSNDNALKMRIWFINDLISGYDDWDWEGARESAEDDQWSIYTPELSTSGYGSDLKKNHVRIYHEVTGADVGFEYHHNHMFGYESNSYYFDQFVMYWGEIIMVSAITEDYVIGDGMLMNVDDGVLLKDGVTLKVMPGGVLSIEGTFYNNGFIENHGTVIVQPDSCITSMMPETKSSGSIVNTGAQVDTKADIQRNVEQKQASLDQLQADIKTQRDIISKSVTAYKEADFKKQQLLKEVSEGRSEPLQTTIERKEAEIEAAEYELSSKIEGGLSEEEIDAYKKDHIVPLKEELEKIKAPVTEQQSIFDAAQQAEKDAQAKIEEDEASIERISNQMTELRRQLSSNTNVNKRGEGNLIVMENARISLEDEAQLSILDGGSCVCNGYIISPNTVKLFDSKLHIRSKGALILNHHLTKNILDAKDLQPKDAGTVRVGFDGLESYKPQYNASMYVSDNYMITVDGILRYDSFPLRDAKTGRSVVVTSGKGAWTYSSTDVVEINDDGSVVSKDEYGNLITRKPDGTVIIYETRTGIQTEMHPDGSKTVIQRDGSKEKTYPNGDFEMYYPSGAIRRMKITTDEYTLITSTVPYRVQYCLLYEYHTPKDGVYAKAVLYDSGDIYELMYNPQYSVRKGFTKDGEWLYDYNVREVQYWDTESYSRKSYQLVEYLYADHKEQYRDGVCTYNGPL